MYITVKNILYYYIFPITFNLKPFLPESNLKKQQQTKPG